MTPLAVACIANDASFAQRSDARGLVQYEHTAFAADTLRLVALRVSAFRAPERLGGWRGALAKGRPRWVLRLIAGADENTIVRAKFLVTRRRWPIESDHGAAADSEAEAIRPRPPPRSGRGPRVSRTAQPPSDPVSDGCRSSTRVLRVQPQAERQLRTPLRRASLSAQPHDRAESGDLRRYGDSRPTGQ